MGRLLATGLKWVVALALLAGLFAAAYLVHQHARRERAEEAETDTVQVPRRVENSVVKLGARLAEAHGIKDEPAGAVSWQRRLPVYGRVVPNPRATAEVRVPFAGTLRGLDGLALGSRVAGGDLLGWVDVRFGPQERLDLQTKLVEAKAKQQGAEEVVKIQQERVERFQSVSAPALARNELDQALVHLAEARTQLNAARAIVKEWQAALAALDRADRKGAAWSQPLTAPAGGEVTELPARPGMTVEPGTVVARVVDFRSALVRLDLPPVVLEAGPPARVELFALPAVPPALAGPTNRPGAGPPPRPVLAAFLGGAPQVDSASQLAGAWYEVDTTAAAAPSLWRPGLFVKAQLPAADAPARAAVAIPAGALLYHQGRALVYVALGAGRYERREVEVLGRQGDRVVVAEGVRADERVVSQRAQLLLSEEFRGAADDD
jgi:hypothetical protein